MARNSYSLLNRSARRRKLALLIQQNQSAEEAPVPLSPLEMSRSQKVPEATLDKSTHATSIEKILLQNRMQDSEEMTWVFAGDADYSTTFASRDSLSRQIEDSLRTKRQRGSDIFVNATYSGARLEQVRRRIQLRFSQSRPDVVVVTCGFAECLGGVEKCSDFETSFIALLKDIGNAGAIPIVCTPPHADVAPQTEGYIDRLIFIEAIRGCVTEHAGILVDFWKDWENQPQLKQYWNTDLQRPTPTGLRRMQKFFLHQLGLISPKRKASKTSSPSNGTLQPIEKT